MRRNLLYNCCAFEWSNEWRLNVEKLNAYAEVFSGRRIVIIRYGQNILPPADVKKAFGFDAEFIEMQNDPVHREASGFVDALGLLESLDANEATFYAHTKGVSYRSGQFYGTVDERNMKPIRGWRDSMYEVCLGDIERVDRVLRERACCGCFLRPFGSSWAFHGTFFWVRHDRLFSANWRSMPGPQDGGIELYPGSLFPVEDAGCLYDDPGRLLYRADHTFRCTCGREFVEQIGIGHTGLTWCPSCGKKTASWV